MIDSRANDIDFFLLEAKRFGNLPMSALNAMAKADRPHAAILIACPSQHRHRIRIVQQQHIRLGHLADILANIHHLGDAPLAVHDAAGTKRIADALIDAVFQRNVDIVLEASRPPIRESSNTYLASLQRFPAIGCRIESRMVKPVLINIPLAQPGHHIQVMRINIRKSNLDLVKFRNASKSLSNPPVKPILPAPIKATLKDMEKNLPHRFRTRRLVKTARSP